MAKEEEEKDSLFRRVSELSEIVDPVSTPYKSKYEARALLEKFRSSAVSSSNNDLVALIDVRLGVNYFQTEETGLALSSLQSALSHLSPTTAASLSNEKKLVCKTDGNIYDSVLPSAFSSSDVPLVLQNLSSAILLHNTLGALYSNLGDTEKSASFLKRSLLAYQLGKRENKQMSQEVENLYTHSTFFFAQTVGTLGYPNESALWCRITLDRQLKSSQLDEMEWAKNCCSLSDFYFHSNDYHNCARCLAASELMLKRVDSDKTVDRERLQCNLAKVMKRWGMLYLEILKKARRSDASDVKPNTNSDEKSSTSIFSSLSFELPCLNNCDIKMETILSSPSVISTFTLAAEIFKIALLSLQQALQYFVFDGFVTPHIEIQLLISSLYRIISDFESDGKRRLAMHNRRASILTSIVHELNPTIYSQRIRQLSFELGEIFTELELLKEKRIEEKINSTKQLSYIPRPIEVRKCRGYAESGIKYFTTFIETFFNDFGKKQKNNQISVFGDLNVLLDSDSKVLDVSDENMRTFVLAHIHIARLSGKLYLYGTKDERSHAMRESLSQHKWILQFAKLKLSNSHLLPQIQEELDLCKQSVELLPKILDKFT
eukprot:g4259.t1